VVSISGSTCMQLVIMSCLKRVDVSQMFNTAVMISKMWSDMQLG